MTTMDSLLAAYTAWALAWMVPLWFGSYLYRSLKRTFAPAGTGSHAAAPALPDRLPTIHLIAA
jgi:hypothetical protein